MATVNLDVSRGDHATLRFTISNLSATGLTSCTVYFKAKRDATEPESAALITKDSGTASQITVVTVGSDTVAGVADVFLLPADTNTLPAYTQALYYDLVVVDSANKHYTVGDGLLVVKVDVDTAQ